MPTINTDGVDVNYTDQGNGSPVLLIHGWPLSGKSWEHQVSALMEAGHRVITYDRRGFGESSKPDDGYDYENFAGDLNALIEELDLSDVSLVGFSMGGGEVVRYISKYGTDRVSKAVLAAAVPPYLYKSDDNPDGGLDDETIEQFENGVKEDREGFIDHFTTDFFSANGELKVSEEERQKAIELGKLASPTATHDCIAAFGRTDFRGDVRQVDVPTLVIHGDSRRDRPIRGQRKAIGRVDRRSRARRHRGWTPRAERESRGGVQRRAAELPLEVAGFGYFSLKARIRSLNAALSRA